MQATVFDATPCYLGEGPMWHPTAKALFWFDIIGKRLYRRMGSVLDTWDFDDYPSAAGWVDVHTLLIATSRGFQRLDIDTGDLKDIAPLEADRPDTRSNDGRADPQGGFWIGTMGMDPTQVSGAIYRYYRNEVRRLFADIRIPNSIAFAPAGDRAYFADTTQGKIMTVALDAAGWPKGAPKVFVDLTHEGLHPDGSVVDAEGCLWNAQWGAGRVARYSPTGLFLEAVSVGAGQSSCPAFGGEGLGTLFVTSAREGMDAAALAADPLAGQTFAAPTACAGQREYQVIL